jgi:hypothetical protein
VTQKHVSGDIERKWTLLVRVPDDEILRMRTGEKPLGPLRDDSERVVVVPLAALAGAVEALQHVCDLLAGLPPEVYVPSVSEAHRVAVLALSNSGGRYAGEASQ